MKLQSWKFNLAIKEARAQTDEIQRTYREDNIKVDANVGQHQCAPVPTILCAVQQPRGTKHLYHHKEKNTLTPRMHINTTYMCDGIRWK